MANKWNYKVRDVSDEREDVLPRVEYDADVMQSSNKSTMKKFLQSFSRDKIKHYSVMTAKIVAISLPLIVALFLVREVQKRQSLNSDASVDQATIFFQNSDFSLPPNGEIEVMMNTEVAVGFARIEVNFDPNLAKLSTSIDTSQSPLKRIVSVSSLEESNSTGKIIIVLGLEPSDLVSAPKGNIKLAKFSFTPNTTLSNQNMALTIGIGSSQVVNTQTSPLNLVANNANVKINTVLATSTPVVTAGPNATTTPAPVLTSTPTSNLDCRSCHRKQCDNVCDPRRDGATCPDCL